MKKFNFILLCSIFLLAFAFSVNADYGKEANLNFTKVFLDNGFGAVSNLYDNDATTRTQNDGSAHTILSITTANATNTSFSPTLAQEKCYSNLTIGYTWSSTSDAEGLAQYWNDTSGTWKTFGTLPSSSCCSRKDFWYNRTICTKAFNFTSLHNNADGGLFSFNVSVTTNPNATLPDTTPPSLIINYPDLNATIDGILYLFYINGSATDSGGVASVVVNNSIFGTSHNNLSNFYFQNVSLVSEQIYFINVTATDNNGNINSTIINFRVDYSKPVLTKILPVDLNSSNAVGISIKIQATDNYLLWDYNLTCLNSSGDAVLSHYQDNILQDTYNPSLLLDWTAYNHSSTNIFNCYSKTRDTHTLNDFEAVVDKTADNEIKGTINNDELTFKLQNAKDFEKFSSMEAIRKDDRYEIIVDLGESTGKYKEYLLTSKTKMHYIPNSKYRGHMVTDGGLWIDFEGGNNGIDIIKNDDYEYIIRDYSDSQIINYKSFGALNTETYNFTITNTAPPTSSSSSSSQIPMITSCPDTLPEVLILGFVIIIALVFLVCGLIFKIEILTLCGSAIFFFIGFYLVGCLEAVGYIIIAFSIIVAIGSFISFLF